VDRPVPRAAPPRCSIPPLLPAALSFAAGAAIVESRVVASIPGASDPQLLYLECGAGAVLAALSVLLVRRGHARRAGRTSALAWVLLLAAACAAGLGSAAGADASTHAAFARLARAGVYGGCVIVASVPRAQASGSWIADVRLDVPGGGCDAVLCGARAPLPHLGERVSLVASVRSPGASGRPADGTPPSLDAQRWESAPDQGPLGAFWSARERAGKRLATLGDVPGMPLLAAWLGFGDGEAAKSATDTMRLA
jgi:hypothetical protein